MRTLLVAVVLGSFALSTAARVAQWAGPETRLWMEATARSPLKVRPWVNLGNALASQREFARAEDCYDTAVRVSARPGRGADERVAGRAMAEVNLGIIEIRWGDFATGRRLIRLAAARMPRSAVIEETRQWAETVSF